MKSKIAEKKEMQERAGFFISKIIAGIIGMGQLPSERIASLPNCGPMVSAYLFGERNV